MALELRKEDINLRREMKEKLREERNTAQEHFDERAKNRENDLENARAVLLQI